MPKPDSLNPMRFTVILGIHHSQNVESASKQLTLIGYFALGGSGNNKCQKKGLASMDKPHPIYPSQLTDFKVQAKHLAEHIAQATSTKIISSFKRNDWLSQALGYKGHTDLIKSTELRKQGDTNQPLALFNDKSIRKDIVEIFSHRANIDPDILKRCVDLTAEKKGEFAQSASILLSVIDQFQAILDSDIIERLDKPRFSKIVDQLEVQGTPHDVIGSARRILEHDSSYFNKLIATLIPTLHARVLQCPICKGQVINPTGDWFCIDCGANQETLDITNSSNIRGK